MRAVFAVRALSYRHSTQGCLHLGRMSTWRGCAMEPALRHAGTVLPCPASGGAVTARMSEASATATGRGFRARSRRRTCSSRPTAWSKRAWRPRRRATKRRSASATAALARERFYYSSRSLWFDQLTAGRPHGVARHQALPDRVRHRGDLARRRHRRHHHHPVAAQCRSSWRRRRSIRIPSRSPTCDRRRPTTSAGSCRPGCSGPGSTIRCSPAPLAHRRRRGSRTFAPAIASSRGRSAR